MLCAIQTGRHRKETVIISEAQLGKMIVPVTAVTWMCSVFILLLITCPGREGKDTNSLRLHSASKKGVCAVLAIKNGLFL